MFFHSHKQHIIFFSFFLYLLGDYYFSDIGKITGDISENRAVKSIREWSELNTLLWVRWERNCSTMRGSQKKFQLDLSVREGCLEEMTWKYEFVERRGIRKLIDKVLMHIQRVRAYIKQSRMKPSVTGMYEGEEKWDLREKE